MRHRARGRHQGYPRSARPSLRSYVIALLAAIALAVSIAGFAGAGASSAAVGQAKAPAARVQAVAGTSSLGDKSTAVRAATIARVAAATAARVHALAYVAAHTYSVRSGDSLSAVAAVKCSGAARDWTGIYAASRLRHWTAENANVLTVGQHLWLACSYDARQLRFAPAPPPPPPAPVVAAAAVSSTRSSYHASYSSGGTYHGSGSMQQCIISRESGGNSQVMNSSAHYGLYQFSASTWAAHGGNPGDFGHASVGEQNQVYYATVAADGYSDWAPYDGC